jgi:hypothetical protein
MRFLQGHKPKWLAVQRNKGSQTPSEAKDREQAHMSGSNAETLNQDWSGGELDYKTLTAVPLSWMQGRCGKARPSQSISHYGSFMSFGTSSLHHHSHLHWLLHNYPND